MKTLLLFCLLFMGNLLFGQTKNELLFEINKLKASQELNNSELTKLKSEISDIKISIRSLTEENLSLKSKLSSQQTIQVSDTTKKNQGNSGQCQAITASGKQCSRMAQSGSKYCWQHQSYENKTGNTNSKTSGTNNLGSGLQTGPRGGQYYINSSGKKTYVKHK